MRVAHWKNFCILIQHFHLQNGQRIWSAASRWMKRWGLMSSPGAGVPRLNIPAYNFIGARHFMALPGMDVPPCSQQAIGMAATWDRELISAGGFRHQR